MSQRKGRTTNAKEVSTDVQGDPVPRDPVLDRARAGDVGAFEQLMRQHYGQVYGVCLGICSNTADAEDAAQETFVRAWRALPAFRGDSALSTWLYRIATNVSLTAVSRRRHTSADLPDRPDPTASPEGQVEGMERVRVVQATLATLSPDARAAFVLRDVEGLPYDEIAEALDISLSAVKSRIFRARQAVADALSAHDAEGVDR